MSVYKFANFPLGTPGSRLTVRPQKDGTVSTTRKIFVFGSNIAGRHGKGAALFAKRHRGAKHGQGRGLQGDSYAIPTKGVSPHAFAPMPVLPLDIIEQEVFIFIDFAKQHPELEFELTPIGCGHAGYRYEQIAPFFSMAPKNVVLPVEFRRIMDKSTS